MGAVLLAQDLADLVGATLREETGTAFVPYFAAKLGALAREMSTSNVPLPLFPMSPILTIDAVEMSQVRGRALQSLRVPAIVGQIESNALTRALLGVAVVLTSGQIDNTLATVEQTLTFEHLGIKPRQIDGMELEHIRASRLGGYSMGTAVSTPKPNEI